MTFQPGWVDSPFDRRPFFLWWRNVIEWTAVVQAVYRKLGCKTKVSIWVQRRRCYLCAPWTQSHSCQGAQTCQSVLQWQWCCSETVAFSHKPQRCVKCVHKAGIESSFFFSFCHWLLYREFSGEERGEQQGKHREKNNKSRGTVHRDGQKHMKKETRFSGRNREESQKHLQSVRVHWHSQTWRFHNRC